MTLHQCASWRCGDPWTLRVTLTLTRVFCIKDNDTAMRVTINKRNRLNLDCEKIFYNVELIFFEILINCWFRSDAHVNPVSKLARVFGTRTIDFEWKRNFSSLSIGRMIYERLIQNWQLRWGGELENVFSWVARVNGASNCKVSLSCCHVTLNAPDSGLYNKWRDEERKALIRHSWAFQQSHLRPFIYKPDDDTHSQG